MKKYKNIRCPDCETVLGKIWPLEYGNVRLELYCKHCNQEQKLNIEITTSAGAHKSTNDLQETHRVLVG